MKVLMVQPGEIPHETDIEPGLESLQAAVDGSIQAVYPYEDPVALICNEEGKFLGLPLNRALRDDTGEIYDMSVPRWDDCEADLPPDLLEKYKEQFLAPESFVRIGGKILAVKQPVPSPENKERTQQPPHKSGPEL